MAKRKNNGPDYKAEATAILAAEREGRTKDRFLLVAERCSALEMAQSEDFAENIATELANVSNMSQKTIPSFNSKVRNVVDTAAPGTIAAVVADMLRSGEWTLPNSYIPTAFKAAREATDAESVKAAIAAFVSEKQSDKGGNGAGGTSRFKKTTAALNAKGVVKTETMKGAADELQAALEELFGRKNAKLPQSVKSALATLRK